MVSAQANGASFDNAPRQRLYHFLRAGTAIDVIAEINLQGAGDRPANSIFFNPQNEFRQKIGTAMNVAYGINPQARRECGS